MRKRTLITIAAAAFAGYLIARDRAHKEMVRMLVKQNAFENHDEKNKED